MLKIIVDHYVEEVWNKKNLKFIKQTFSPKAVLHSLFGNFSGPDAMQVIAETWIKGFPDLKVINDDFICENDKVMVRWSSEGTHLGNFKGIPATGKRVHFTGMTIYRIEKDKVVEYWACLDMDYLLNQIR